MSDTYDESDSIGFRDNDKFVENVMELFDPRLRDSLDYAQSCKAASLVVDGYHDFDAAVLAVIASMFDTPVSVRKESKPFEDNWYGVTLNTEVGDVYVEIAMVEVEPGVYSREASVRWPNNTFLNTEVSHAHIVKKRHIGWAKVRSAARHVKSFHNTNHY